MPATLSMSMCLSVCLPACSMCIRQIQHESVVCVCIKLVKYVHVNAFRAAFCAAIIKFLIVAFYSHVSSRQADTSADQRTSRPDQQTSKPTDQRTDRPVRLVILRPPRVARRANRATALGCGRGILFSALSPRHAQWYSSRENCLKLLNNWNLLPLLWSSVPRRLLNNISQLLHFHFPTHLATLCRAPAAASASALCIIKSCTQMKISSGSYTSCLLSWNSTNTQYRDAGISRSTHCTCNQNDNNRNNSNNCRQQ